MAMHVGGVQPPNPFSLLFRNRLQRRKSRPCAKHLLDQAGQLAGGRVAWSITWGSAALTSRICINCVLVGRLVEPMMAPFS